MTSPDESRTTCPPADDDASDSRNYSFDCSNIARRVVGNVFEWKMMNRSSSRTSRFTTDILNYRKKAIYLHYSHSRDHLKKKQERYFNRSNVISEQPFSIRIEAYEMKLKLQPRRFAVWRYPTYFDYLPVYRLATVLRFFPPREGNPCQRNPCGRNEDCYRV